MLHVMSVDNAGKKWLRKCIFAYLDGEQDLRWILGVVRGSGQEAMTLLQTEFQQLRGTARYQELQGSLHISESST